MARTDQRRIGGPRGPLPGLPGVPGPEAQRAPRRRVSTGHVVMVVAALVAALLTYSVLRQAGGPGTAVVVAAEPLSPGEVVSAAQLTTTTLKAGPGVMAHLVTPANESTVLGKPAAVAIAKGQVIQADEFAAAAPSPPRMTILVDPEQIPGGLDSLAVGSRIDLLGVTSNGVGVVVPGLEVLQVPVSSPVAGALSNASTTVPIDVAVPTVALAGQIFEVTTGKFEIRLADPSSPAPALLPSSAPASPQG